ncbi:MAG: hypothetical protein ABI193_08425 [Minicystis sp.]
MKWACVLGLGLMAAGASCAKSGASSASGTSSGAGGEATTSTSITVGVGGDSSTTTSATSTTVTTGNGGNGGATTATTGAGGGTTTGSGGSGPDAQIGCSDGTREGFGDLMKFKTIAACDGAWDVPGIFELPVSCNRQGGNSGMNPSGVGCSVSDLCAEGWHVCYGRDDVLFRNPAGCEGVMTGAQSPVFFTTQMSSTGAFECSTQAGATNDLFGCGDLGCDFTSNPTVQMLCAPLVRSSHDLCKGLRNDLGCGDWCNHLGKYPALTNAWNCGNDGAAEALNVTKSQGDQQGGVLCCLN